MATATMPAPREVNLGEGVQPLRISRALYDRMIEAGIFTTRDRIELLEGRLYEMSPMGNPHRAVLNHIAAWIHRSVPEGWHINSQTPIALDDFSEPEPDFAIVRGTTKDYLDHQPAPADIGLIVEVSDTSLAYDRKRKLPVYAETGIPEYWIINLMDNVIEIRTDPCPREGEKRGFYSTTREFRGDHVVTLRLDGEIVTEIRVDELLLLSEP